MNTIIDMHTHLGDICFPGGGKLIYQTGIRRRQGFDIIALSERMAHRWKRVYALLGKWYEHQEISASLARNATATLENSLQSMAAAGVGQSVVLPIPPHVHFSDLLPAVRQYPALIPFTGIDFSREGEMVTRLVADIRAGARGVKLHPILQGERLTSRKTHESIEAVAPFRLPVLLHTGSCRYYLDPEHRSWERPEYGCVGDALSLAKAFPAVRFIFGHAGLTEWPQLRDGLNGLRNVWVDCSFRSAVGVRDLIRTLGPERVLFGSDWPWGRRRPAIRIIEQACGRDAGLARRIFSENAEELLADTLPKTR